MILAGGQGVRLSGLTKNTAKPALPFAGKHRIIDFSINNSLQSGLHTVAVLTQYAPKNLHSYISDKYKNIHLLPPKPEHEYKGTANAIYQNSDFINAHNADYVVILSGDHIYSMDYAPMIQKHINSGAACTISAITVPKTETDRFGIMTIDENDIITNFEEKPAETESCLASMGVYVFSWDVLKKHLMIDENNPNSVNDFGKNVIPQMLARGEKMVAYEFEGYWRDVGTVESLWAANMDFAPFVSDKSFIRGNAQGSIIFDDVVIEKGAFVTNSVVMRGARITSGCIVKNAIIGEDITLENNSYIATNAVMLISEGEKIDKEHASL
jgi:glucose-1-phosphate adenylyltransferase